MTTQIIDSPRRPCLHSTRYRNEQGYPIRAFGPRGAQKRFYEHRLVYEQAHGPIPPDVQIDHLCHGWDTECRGGPSCLHRRCVEITHLEAVPQKVNVLRGRGPTAVNAVKTRCGRGHEFTPDNTLRRKDTENGLRQCKACARAATERLGQRGIEESDPRHGSLVAYNTYRCRCDRCRAAMADYKRRRRAEA